MRDLHLEETGEELPRGYRVASNDDESVDMDELSKSEDSEIEEDAESEPSDEDSDIDEDPDSEPDSELSDD